MRRPSAEALRRRLGRGRAAPTSIDHVLARRQADLRALSEEDRRIVEPVLPYTMTSVPRVRAVVDAVRYVVERDLPGAFAECGVWRGGSVLAMIRTLQALGVEDRDLVLYDTFEGMTEPGEEDVPAHPAEPPAVDTWKAALAAGEKPWGWWFGPDQVGEDVVRETLVATGYPAERLRLVRGPVEATLPAHAPGPLALLRLDTDWYASTRHELEHLWPLLAPRGVLVVDDYGHWKGAARAVDEFFAAHPPRPFLVAVDYTGRVAVKA